jgi:methylphosphotriester-DNA--protein-cysteine methyltransferase
MLVEQFSHKSTQNNVKSLEELCSWIDAHIDQQINWIDLMEVSGLDHLTLQAEFSKNKLMTPMTWIRKRKEALTGRNISSVAPNRYAWLLAHSSN